jgi:polysaccharide biosynthesis/export protein
MKTHRIIQRLFVLGALLGAIASLPLAAAQLPQPKSEKKYVAYRITRGDTVSVGILGEQDLSAGGKRVEATGTINLPLIQEVRLVGLTIAEAQETIAKKYRDERYLRNPQVSVTVEVYAPRTVIISGKVNLPGRPEIPADTEITIKDMISKAGGFGETARGTQVKVTRTMPDGTLKTFTLDVESALKGRAPSDSGDAAFVLQPADIIYVPEKII